ncbi:uncharacterized protein LOC117103253 [Anneissia japonica]|uniref:uncharacterized protein LOC117103253 n=1 Tax=Anneissia japonica TaxID=1529436 RepID=UPI001425789C|nr:uncharacterized protein LOC117103253 [Anneissia japonica]
MAPLCLFFLACYFYPLPAVSVDIKLFGATVQFSGQNSCFKADDQSRGCKCDTVCVKYQDCCLDYEIWQASISNFSVDGKISNTSISNWKDFIDSINPQSESLSVDLFPETLNKIENLVMGRKKNLVEFKCEANIVSCKNTTCNVLNKIKILTVGSCNKQHDYKACAVGESDFLVYDKLTELVFINEYCAQCNSIDPSRIIPFVKIFNFQGTGLNDRFLNALDLEDTNKTMQIIENANPYKYQVLPPDIGYRLCEPKIYACDQPNNGSDLLNQACLAYQDYNNPSCFVNSLCEYCAKPECSPDFKSTSQLQISIAIFIDSTGGLTTVYPTTPDDKFDTDDVVSLMYNNSLPFGENITNQDPTFTADLKEGVTAVYLDISFAITLTGTILSIISIVIALLTFYFFPSMQNTSGWINILLLITILLRCFLYLLLLIDKEIPPACRAVAIAQHFGLLCTFCWINCLGLNIFLSTKSKPVFSKNVQKKLFWYYCLYSFCTPALIVICCVAVEYSSIEVATIYEYTNCFLTNKAIKLAFIVPISVMMLVNATLYAIIIRNVKKKSHVKKEESAGAKNKRRRFEFILSIKIMLAFGLYWLFGIIATVIVELRQGETTTASLVLNMLFVFTGSMQGVFVCVAVVFNKRVVNMWRQKLKIPKPKMHARLKMEE